MPTYIVSLMTKPAKAVYDGVWGVFSTLEKARAAIEYWISQYKETQLDYHERANGQHVYETNKSNWIIDIMVLDSM